MKYFLLFFGLLIICRCTPDKKIDYKKVNQKVHYIKVKDNSNQEYDVSVYEYTIDSCQYIGEIDIHDTRGCYLTHKGNCTNPIHKQ